MNFSLLDTRLDGRVFHVTLNRPDRHNALNLGLCRELVTAFDHAMQEDDIGALLLDGAGKSFCSGMDLTEMLEPGARELTHVHELVFTLMTRATKPIVAAVHGNTLAGGVGLAANSHILLASSGARFGLTEIRIGLWPFLIYRAVAAAVGERKAVELSMTGRLFDAAEAQRIGLVHEVVAPDQLGDRALELARSLGDSSPNALRNGLLFVNESRGKSITDAGKIAFRFRDEMFRSADFAEGIRAFHEKRKPQWPKTD